MEDCALVYEIVLVAWSRVAQEVGVGVEQLHAVLMRQREGVEEEVEGPEDRHCLRGVVVVVEGAVVVEVPL